MYFWKIGELKKLIIKRGLSEKQIFHYILAYTILYVIGLELVTYVPRTDFNVWNYLLSGLNIAIPIVGTIAAYRANGGARGNAFAAKYFSIGLVMLIRFFVYLLPLMFVLFAFYGFFSEQSFDDEETIPTGWFDVLVYTAWHIAMYVRMYQHISDTAKAKSK